MIFQKAHNLNGYFE